MDLKLFGEISNEFIIQFDCCETLQLGFSTTRALSWPSIMGKLVRGSAPKIGGGRIVGAREDPLDVKWVKLEITFFRFYEILRP